MDHDPPRFLADLWSEDLEPYPKVRVISWDTLGSDSYNFPAAPKKTMADLKLSGIPAQTNKHWMCQC